MKDIGGKGHFDLVACAMAVEFATGEVAVSLDEALVDSRVERE
jgi:hypothetical protein